MDDIQLVEVIECPHCGEFVEMDGPDGVIPHFIERHRDTLQAKAMILVAENG